MKRSLPRGAALGVLVVLLGTACSSATTRSGSPPAIGDDGLTPAAALRLEQLGYTAADVHFMSGMIPHHAQAVVMAGWAATHGARSAVRILCERIVVAQADEIVTMQNWLRDRGEPVPDAEATHLTMTMNGVEHNMLMPGMLTAEELAQLDRARGPEFDRLFLTFMIRHHEGALSMVDELFGSAGAAQDDVVFKFASDVYADQSTEIDRMQTMLEADSSGGSR